jgi:hypothetical protein
MSIFGKIMSSIFGTSGSGTTPYAGASTTGMPGAGMAPAPGAGGAAGQVSGTKPGMAVDIAANLDALAKASKEKFDWRKSIVDLMKLLNLDSSLASRKELAKELGYTGNMNDSAAMNMWLHKQVMTKLAENGGKVPDELK